MQVLEKIRIWLDAIDQAALKRYLILSSGLIALLLGVWVWFFYQTIDTLRTKIRSINSKRRETSALLARRGLVKKQQAEVDEILSKQPNFKITQTFDSLLEKIGITANKAQEPQTTSSEVLDTYTEWTLFAQLNNISMKKLTEFLYALEQEQRIYTKEVDIERNSSGRFVNVKISIATLEPKAVVNEGA